MNPVNLFDIKEPRSTVVINDQFKVVYFHFVKGTGLGAHLHNGHASIQILKGSVELKFETGEIYLLEAGTILGFDARIIHTVTAITDSTLIITLSSYNS